MQCPNCSRNIDETHFPASLAFCPYCGQDLLPVSQETERLAFCPYCGRELPDQTSFCPHCGKGLKVGEKRIPGQKVSKVLLERVAQPIVKRVIQPIVKAVRSAFSSERKTRKLFQQWSEYSELSPDEIPSIEALREMPEIGRARRSPRWYLAAGIAALIVIALIIILVNQC